MPECKECGEECSSDEFLRRHVRRHKMTAQEYSLKWVYDGKVPLCKCGCGKETSWNNARKAYAEFVLGHHAWGRKKSDEEKRAIGAANSVNMTRFMTEHPEYAKEKGRQLRSTWTPEKEANRIAATRRAYANLTSEQRQRFRDHALRLLDEGLIGPQAPFKTEWVVNPFTERKEYMHSSWETSFLDRCIKEGYPVSKTHDLRIPYMAHDGSEHVYVPDFVALEDKVVFEIKGLMRENDDAKLQALDEWADRNGYEVVVVSEL